MSPQSWDGDLEVFARFDTPALAERGEAGGFAIFSFYHAILSEMSTQNYQNHTQRVPGFLALGLVLLIAFIGACVNLYQSLGDHQRVYSASLLVVVVVCVFFTAAFARTFALKAQDRAIRAEENLRHYVLTGKLLDGRLTVPQIVALRFAGDEEFPGLANEAASCNLEPKAIKLKVKNWRGDFYRV